MRISLLSKQERISNLKRGVGILQGSGVAQVCADPIIVGSVKNVLGRRLFTTGFSLQLSLDLRTKNRVH